MYMPSILLLVGLAFISEIQACRIPPCNDNLKLCVKDGAGIGGDCSGIVARCVEECPPGSREFKYPSPSIPENSSVSSRGNLAEGSTKITLALHSTTYIEARNYFIYILEGTNCCGILIIDSTGFTRQYQSYLLGTYQYDGISNGKNSYKHISRNMFLYYSTKETWLVRKIRIYISLFIIMIIIGLKT